MTQLTTLRIATRKSQLALWQANNVKQQLQQAYPKLRVELVEMVTEGDKHLETRLQTIGGKGLFIKELEQALLQKQADIAVHSLKDLTVNFPPELGLAAVCQRADPRDALVSNSVASLCDLPPGSVVGTSSLRRECQVRIVRPDIAVVPLRGNLQTRLNKLDQGAFSAIILAAAGLERLNLKHRIRAYLSIQDFIPAVGQGVIAIECCRENAAVWQLMQSIHNKKTYDCITAERAINQRLGGGCHLPLAAYAELHENEIHLQGWIGDIKQQTAIKTSVKGSRDMAESIGLKAADNLLAQGADKILRAL
jgi:hydroxymethylbilane synthase